MKEVAVTLEKDGTIGVLAWFGTVEDAERYIASMEASDPIGVYNGDYGIDAPESLLKGN